MDVPKDQLSTLLDHGLYSSAQMLVLYGDSLFREKEYRRAIQIYKQALQYHKILPKQNATTPPATRSALSALNRSSSPNAFNTSAINENEVKFKIATCHSALGENRAALAEVCTYNRSFVFYKSDGGNSSKSRNLEMNLMMAKLYRNSRHTRAAIGCFKECLRNCPYIIEAIVALAELGVSAKDIISLFPQTPNRSGRPPSIILIQVAGCRRYVEAQCCIASNDYKGGLELFSNFYNDFQTTSTYYLKWPSILSSSSMLKLMIQINQYLGRFSLNHLIDKVRSIDPYVVTYMDEYAMLLKLKSDHSKLNKLVHDLLNIDPTKPEVFVALSVLWEKKDERGALSYAEKSIRIDERHVAGYIMKGNLYLSMNRPEAAVIAYRGAQELRPDLRSYQAREAMKAMPQSAKALKLVGDVHASNTSGREKAGTWFLGAALALAELHVMEGRNGDAVSLLERYLKDWADDSLHVKLAQVFAATNMLQDALSHYQAALR
ncbi:hypothetical protein DH2020_048944 [Rehmannia glutinosa]|uniref:Anaphase-promoting complex subunit 7 n=1 Tax=Rehmannia glutinosa TaxID=99300 RepID=A0ABR0U5B3_REHGL